VKSTNRNRPARGWHGRLVQPCFRRFQHCWASQQWHPAAWLLGLAVLGVALMSGLAPAAAQDSVDKSEGPAALEEPAQPPAPASASADAAPPAERTLLDTLRDGGVVGLLILLLSVVAVAYVVQHFRNIRKSVLMPETVLLDLERLIAEGKIDDAIDYCHQKESQSMASRVILAGLFRYKNSQFGFAEYKSAVEEAGEEETAGLYRKTEVLGVIGQIAPMLGLLGTVVGMIMAFNTIAARGGMARPDELAGGIGQALITTLMGLVVAIPAMIAFSYFRNRIDSIVSEAGARVERIMMPLGRQGR
jgi:biopolymer transport protein ExbB